MRPDDWVATGPLLQLRLPLRLPVLVPLPLALLDELSPPLGLGTPTLDPESCKLLRVCASGARLSFMHARGADEPKPAWCVDSLVAFGVADLGRC